ncbi:MAG: hypothetical protein M1151_05325 [Candidatus Thermoplasmatota archaeon]|jgi:hypothetical protein|nr:hypothetical protein [Candidatus Thermoplasmatota archaeon]
MIYEIFNLLPGRPSVVQYQCENCMMRFMDKGDAVEHEQTCTQERLTRGVIRRLGKRQYDGKHVRTEDLEVERIEREVGEEMK